MSNKNNYISIHTDYIELQQFLKLANLIQTGGQAKTFISENDIVVNGTEEKRRKRKLVNEDVVIVNGSTFYIKQLCI